jgi:Fe-S cluster biosynthesis and repair protein YggX
MDLAQRIAQFENMAQADPTNEMAHFSLARAYAEAGRLEDAAGSYLRCTEVNPDMSKAFQLGAEMLIKAGKPRQAEAVLLKGYEVAAVKGDLMPKRAMAEMMKTLGMTPPKVAGEDTKAEALEASGAFMCSKTGRPGTKMERAPFRGSVGLWIAEHISAETWREWIGQGTKVINELRLDLSRDQDSETYDKYMREYVGLDDETFARISGKGSGE